MRPRLNLAAARALGKRDLRRYFGNPTGYIFITLFIFLSAAAAFWRPRFFLNNLANLDQLNEAFPYLLLFFVPALCMGLWSDERKQGTDELLLTLPATELAVVFGKYAAAVGIYSAALVVSLSHAIVLAWLGRPDAGLLAASYLGYWLMGAALIPLAMLASLLTANATIAFILGSLLCAAPIGLSPAAATIGESLARRLAALGVFPHFGDFTRGIVSLVSLLYFVCLAGFFLYLNVLVLARRHWRRQRGTPPMWVHGTARALALALALAALIVLAARAHARLDLTAERLYSLSVETRALVAALPADRPVVVQAFVSPEIPEPFVQIRENVLGLLREIEAIGGPKVTVTVQDTEAYSEQARLARERYNIYPQTVTNPYSGETARDVYLGVAVTSGAEEQVIPFFERGLSPEYEIVRAIRVVSRAQRKRIGIVDTDAKILGGVDFRSHQPRPTWAIVQELRNQYDVVEVTPAGAGAATLDALLIVLPSRLTQTEMNLVAAAIKRGTPTMLLVDPLPVVDIRLAPAAELAEQVDPYRRTNPDQGQARIVYGNIRQMLADFGINWVPARIVWDRYNPHPDMSDLPPETVFVGTGNGNPDAFNRRDPAAAGLQELLLLYPGYFLPTDSPEFSFEPLVQTGRLSGSSTFFEVVRPSPTGLTFGPAPTHEPDQRQYAIAAQIRSKPSTTAGGPAAGARPVTITAIADIDFISDSIFQIRAVAPPNVSLDNITFFLNAMDVLAGDESWIALRNRRGRHRTLARVEVQTRSFMERRMRDEQQAEKDARAAVDDARKRLKTRVQEIDQRSDLDVQAKQILVRNLEESENRQLRVLETNIEQAKNVKIQASRETMEAQIRAIRTRIRTFAVLLPPVPVFLIGVALFVRRTRREHESARTTRRLRGPA